MKTSAVDKSSVCIGIFHVASAFCNVASSFSCYSNGMFQLCVDDNRLVKLDWTAFRWI